MEPPAPVSAAFSVRVVKFIINAFWYGTWISLVIRLPALVTGGSFKGENLGSLSGFLDSIAFETPAWSDALPIVSSLGAVDTVSPSLLPQISGEWKSLAASSD